MYVLYQIGRRSIVLSTKPANDELSSFTMLPGTLIASSQGSISQRSNNINDIAVHRMNSHNRIAEWLVKTKFSATSRSHSPCGKLIEALPFAPLSRPQEQIQLLMLE